MSKIGMPVITLFKRCKDRGFRYGIESIRGDVEHKSDGVRTTNIIQDDLEALYTGKEIDAFFVYA